MSADIDFKTLWNREESGVPDVKEIFEKARQLTVKIRKKIWRHNIVLSITAIFLIWVLWYFHPRMITTKIGIAFVVLAIVSFLTVANSILPLLFKVNLEVDSRQYLNQLIQIKHRQDFLSKAVMNCYFILLSLGVFLYMMEYVRRGSVVFQLLAYGSTSLWLAFNWFYIRPKTINKQQKAINDVIEKVEMLNVQLIKEE